MDKQGRPSSMSPARELLSREDALLGSALVAGRVTREEIHEVSDLVAQRAVMYDVSLSLLPGRRARFQRYWKNADTASLRVPNRRWPTAPPAPRTG